MGASFPMGVQRSFTVVILAPRLVRGCRRVIGRSLQTTLLKVSGIVQESSVSARSDSCNLPRKTPDPWSGIGGSRTHPVLGYRRTRRSTVFLNVVTEILRVT